MTLKAIPSSFGSGGANLTDGTLKDALKELQAFKTKVVPAKGAGLNIPLAGIKTRDTLQSAIVYNSGVPVDVLAAASIPVDGAIRLTGVDTYKGVCASGTLTSDNTNVADGDTVTIGTKVYTFKTELGTTEGQVLIGANADASLLNLIRAINHSGTPGTDYHCAAAHPTVSAATSVTSHAFAVTAKADGADGNAIATTETSAHLSWGAATLASGEDGKPMVVSYFAKP